MKDLFSPGNLITVTGAVLTVIGVIAYLTGAVNLSVPTLFYGFPIFLAGIALKSSELPPAKKVTKKVPSLEAKNKAPKELEKLISDVTRWRYGQKAHLESSLKVLNLWEDSNPPQLIEIEEIETNGELSIRMRFDMAGVKLDRWQEKKERLGRFFAKGLQAEIINQSSEKIDLMLLPQNNQEANHDKNGLN